MAKHPTTRIRPLSTFVLAWALPLLLATCTSLAPPSDGTLKCGAAPHPCPDGFECSAVTNTCWPRGKGPSSDGAVGDVARVADGGASDARSLDVVSNPSDAVASFEVAKDGVGGEDGATDAAPDAPVTQSDGSPVDLAARDLFTPLDLSASVDAAPAFDQAQSIDAVAGVCASAANGTPCGTGMVCNGSQCVQCVAGDSCPVPTSCHRGTWSCSTGIRTCVDNGNAEDGTACAGGNVCAKGICTSCVAGGGCPLPGNPCRLGVLTCSGGSSLCVDSGAKPDGTACDDANACTTSDKCMAGVCSPGTAKTCAASDQCHAAGTCDPATGNCSNPNQTEGATCTDGNPCTLGEACHAGVCNGGAPKSCSASDQCHDVGVCNSGTGLCSNPAKANGSGCSDGNACTQSDTCQGGSCMGASPVTCTALDQCHDIGTCNTSSGVCTNPAKAEGATCSDGNACTRTDACQSGRCVGSPVTCTALDQCHVVGVCDTGTGACSNPTKGDGAGCEDGNRCTTGDACQAGSCRPGTAKVCNPAGECYVAGTCDPGTGDCSNPYAPNGTYCSDFLPDDGTCCSGSCTYSGCAH